MIGDTLRQKYLYATPFKDDGFPLVVLDDEKEFCPERTEYISGQSLYFWKEDELHSFIKSRKHSTDSIVIINDYNFDSRNKCLEDGARCHMMSFAYLLKKAGFSCAIKQF